MDNIGSSLYAVTMRLITALMMIGHIVVLTGCDPAYRIRRDNTQLNQSVSVQCLKDAIALVPGIRLAPDPVYARQYAPLIPCAKGMSLYQIEYWESEKPVLSSTCFDGSVLKTFTQFHNGIISNTYPKRVAKVRSQMKEVELSIEKHCSIKGLSVGMKDDCDHALCRD